MQFQCGIEKNMNNNILIFSKYLGFNVGGAERSLHTLLEHINFPKEYIGANIKKTYDARSYEVDIPVKRFTCIEIPRFPYFEYWINRTRIREAIQNTESEILLTQGVWAAAALRDWKGKSILFIRSEYQINQMPFKHLSWWRCIIKCVYLLVQAPFLYVLYRDSREAILHADIVVANSAYMQRRIKEKFGRESLLVYPMRDLVPLQDEVLPALSERPFITLIGSERIKGSHILEQIANAIPEIEFLVVGRDIVSTYQKGNITYHPWVKDPLEIYRRTCILLVPSLWAESSPGVIVEAMTLGIPVLASDMGGITELVYPEAIVEPVGDMQQWVAKIRKILSDQDNTLINIGKNRSVQFDYRIQVRKFLGYMKLFDWWT